MTNLLINQFDANGYIREKEMYVNKVEKPDAHIVQSTTISKA